MTCRFSGYDQPRVIVGRHLDECADQHDDDEHGCQGCQPCYEAHCRRCYRTHAEGACPSCIADVRETIGEIQRMCGELPAEAEVKGVNSEAFNLLGPAADPEALGHMSASVAVGRIPAHWLESADNDRHPLIVAGGWMEVYVEAFDHDEPSRITVASALDYLARNLHEAGDLPDVPFEDMARDLGACKAHMAQVLHDGEQIETGAPCMTCRKPLVRVWGDIEAQDGWTCHSCRENVSEAQYALAVRMDYIAHADWLTDADAAIRFNTTPAAIRQQAKRQGAKRERRDGRTVYDVAGLKYGDSDEDRSA